MTGFRVSPGGWSALDPAPADLYTFGKVMGGGLPAAAFGGRTEIMSRLAPAGPVYQAGTLSGNPLACAAGLATLRLATGDVYARLDRDVGDDPGPGRRCARQGGRRPPGVHRRQHVLGLLHRSRRGELRRREDAERRGVTRRSSTPCWPVACTCRRARTRRGSCSTAIDDEALDRLRPSCRSPPAPRLRRRDRQRAAATKASEQAPGAPTQSTGGQQ